MKSHWKLLIPFLSALAAACGSEGIARNEQAAVECSLRVAANDDAIRLALQQVEDGTLDPCSGALSQSVLYSAKLSRVDRLDGTAAYVQLVYLMRLRHPNDPRTAEP